MNWFRPVLIPARDLTALVADVRVNGHNIGAVLTQLHQLREILMASLDDLQSAVDRNGAAVGSAVTALADQRQKIAALQAAIDNGQLDQERLAAITASIDASSDAVAQALAPVVEDTATPTPPEVDVPPATNPDTAPPESVDGAVPAGDPLPAA